MSAGVKKVLAVDDNEQGLHLLEEILRAAGYDVVTAADGIEALNVLEQGTVNLIISDILMPRMDGFQLCRFVKTDERHKATKFVFYTGNYTDQEDEDFAISLGAERIIVKPIEISSLIEILNGVLEKDFTPKVPSPLIDGDSFLAEHNIRLFNKLESKLAELEELNKKLAASEANLSLYSRHLEELVEERTKELMESRETLFRQERLAYLGQLAGEVSHELRGPLATIANAGYYLQSILDQSNETVREYLEIIVSEIQRANRIIHNLLDITAIRTADRTWISLLPLLNKTLENNPAPAGISVRIDSIPELPLVYVDPEHFIQIASNIINNAYQAMPEGGSLTIGIGQEDQHLILRFTDTGCGIPADKLEEIFEPLVSLSGKGTGLGLPLARNLAELNGGSIRLESCPGKGSTFILSLPLADQ